MILDLFFRYFRENIMKIAQIFYGCSSNFYLDVFYLVIFVCGLGSNGIHHFSPTFGMICLVHFFQASKSHKSKWLSSHIRWPLETLGEKWFPNLPVNRTKNLCHSQVFPGSCPGCCGAGSWVTFLLDGWKTLLPDGSLATTSRSFQISPLKCCCWKTLLCWGIPTP